MTTNAGGKADDDDSRLERDEPVAATKVSLGVGGLGSRLSARHLADDYLESEARLGPVKTLPGLGTSSSLLQHPSSPPVRKEYHQRFGRRWIYVVGDSGAITAGSRTVGDVHPSPPVRIWNRW